MQIATARDTNRMRMRYDGRNSWLELIQETLARSAQEGR